MNEVMLQAFHWFLAPKFPGSSGRNLWQFLKDESDHYREIGIDAVWIPPACQTKDEHTVGYDIYDHFNAGEFPVKGRPGAETRYGTKSQLTDAIKALHGNGSNKYINVYADMVLNHKAGGEVDDYWQAIRVNPEDRTDERSGTGYERGEIEIQAYTRFDFPERAGKYSTFTWRAKHFDSVDTTFSIRQNGNVFPRDGHPYIYRFLNNEENYLPPKKNFERWVSLEKGNFDYLTSCDFDYGRYDVREEMKYWGEWFIDEFQIDGVRLDAVKHISSGYVREWLGHVRAKSGGKEIFAVGEYLETTTPKLHEYITQVSHQGAFPQRITLFDFPLFHQFREAGFKREAFDLRQLGRNTFVEEQPHLAVTFVENHDFEYGRNVDSHVPEWFKPLAYAFILLRQSGYPCIFFPDYYGSMDVLPHLRYKAGSDYLDLLLKLRRQFALGEERSYAAQNVLGWVRMGFVQNAKGAMAVVMNNSTDVRSIEMNTGRFNKSFYHLATIKWTPGGFLVVYGQYNMYGDKAVKLFTREDGVAAFPADGETVSIWIEDGVGLS